MLLFTFASCMQTAGFGKPDTDAPVDTGDTSGPDTDDTDDTVEDTDDLDRDGFSTAEGDCDDADIHVSPAREEDPSDGLDNDCDGRVDEEFSGLDVAYANSAGSSDILTIDTIGRLTASVTLDGGCTPSWLDHAGDGWVINNGYAEVARVAADGTCTPLADFSDAEVYEYGVWGIATAPDGTIYAATIGSLVAIAPDGGVTEVATWVVDLEDVEAHDLAAAAVAVDPVTGEVALFDYFGGFATWSAADGLNIWKKGDYMAPAIYTSSGNHRDGGGWYAPGIDAATGAYGIYRWDTTDWVLEEVWEDEDWEPFMLAIDGDSGDYYVTANAGWFYTVWRVVAGREYAADLYVTDGTERNRAFQGIVANY